MKNKLFASLILAGMSTAALALPLSAVNLFIADGKTNSTLTAGAADHSGLHQIAYGGAERLQERLRVAEDGAERLRDRQKKLFESRDQVAEGGAERLLERQKELLKKRVLFVEDGADRTGVNRVS